MGTGHNITIGIYVIDLLLQAGNGDDSVDEECRLMTMAELSYINRIRNIQLKRFPKTP